MSVEKLSVDIGIVRVVEDEKRSIEKKGLRRWRNEAREHNGSVVTEHQ